MRIYLDACCFNRPFDDRHQIRVRLEAEAVLAILDIVAADHWILLSSSILELELGRISAPERKNKVLNLLSLAHQGISADVAEKAIAADLQLTHGFLAFDALHLACAVTLNADVFLTTDDRLLHSARRLPHGLLPFTIANPLGWLTDLGATGNLLP